MVVVGCVQFGGSVLQQNHTQGKIWLCHYYWGLVFTTRPLVQDLLFVVDIVKYMNTRLLGVI